MSRFEVIATLSLRDTETGEAVELINNTYHMDDKKLDQSSPLDTYVADIKKVVDLDHSNGHVYNYSSFTRFVECFYTVMEEITPEPPVTENLDVLFQKYEVELAEMESRLQPKDGWVKGGEEETIRPKYLN